MVLRFKCEYNGKNFGGFQRQGNGTRTVQAELESALSKYFGEIIKIAGSGRTDAGVHAHGQVCSFLMPENVTADPFRLCTAINAFLPDDISVRDFEIMPDRFHAQFSAKAKTYLYKVYISRNASPLRDDFYHRVYKQPNIEAMQEAARGFVGTHDFRDYCSECKTDVECNENAYAGDGAVQCNEKAANTVHGQVSSDCLNAADDCADNGNAKGFVRTIYAFDVKQQGDEIYFIIRGNGFLRNMVRRLVGALLEIGLGKTANSYCAPAKGLCLMEVEY